MAVIRPARAGDLVRLRAVERAAGGVFRDIGMGPVADDEPLTVSDLAGYQQDGRAWVAVDEQDRPVAYLLIDRVDNGAHVEQVSVHPDHARQGVGLALIDTAVIGRRGTTWRRSPLRPSGRSPGTRPTTLGLASGS